MATERDPNWKKTDSHGHVHRYKKVGEKLTTPTLIWHPVMVLDEDGDEYDDGYYACLECGDRVTLGRRASTYSQFVRGLTQATGRYQSSKLRKIGDAIPLSQIIPGAEGKVLVTETTTELKSPTDPRIDRAKTRQIITFISDGPITLPSN